MTEAASAPSPQRGYCDPCDPGCIDFDPVAPALRGDEGWERLASSYVNTPEMTGSNGDYLGSGMGIVGDHMIAVAAFDRMHNSGQGSLHTYRRINGSWQFSGRLAATPDGSPGGMAPRLTDRSGDRMILGGPNGKFLIVRQQGDGWIHEPIAADAQFGFNYQWTGVSIDGDRAVVVHPAENVVRVLHWSGTQWAVERSIALSGPAGQGPGYHTLDLDGDRFVVGRWGDATPTEPNVGTALIYREQDGEWTLEAELNYAGSGVQPRFGHVVAIEGDVVAVSANGDDVDGRANVGSVALFRRIGGIWTAVASVTPADAIAQSGFGYRVLLANGRLFVSSFPQVLTPDVADGGLREYRLDATPPLLVDHLVNVGSQERLGLSLDVQGDELVVGVPTRLGKGGVRTYVRNGPTWQQQQLIEQPDTIAPTNFGANLATDDGHLLVRESKVPFAAGGQESVVQAYERFGADWQHVQTLHTPESPPSQSFGWVMATRGGLAFIGRIRAADQTLWIDAYRFELGTWVARDSLDVTSLVAGHVPTGINIVPGDGFVALSMSDSSQRFEGQPARAAWVVEMTESATFGAVHALVDPQHNEFNAFGRALAVDGERIAVYEPFGLVGDTHIAGVTTVYVRSNGTWLPASSIPNRGSWPIGECSASEIQPPAGLVLHGNRLLIAHNGGVDGNGDAVAAAIDTVLLQPAGEFELVDSVDSDAVDLARDGPSLVSRNSMAARAYELPPPLSLQNPSPMPMPTPLVQSFSAGGGLLAVGTLWDPQYSVDFMGAVFVREFAAAFTDGFE